MCIPEQETEQTHLVSLDGIFLPCESSHLCIQLKSMDSSIAAKIDFSKAFKIAKLMLIIVIMIIIIYYFVVISVIKFCMRLPSPALGALHKAMKKNRNLIIIKVIPLFCIAHPLLRIRFRHPRWRRFFPLARKEQTRAAFAELKLLFAIIMSQIG